jgi:hypothetical protein
MADSKKRKAAIAAEKKAAGETLEALERLVESLQKENAELIETAKHVDSTSGSVKIEALEFQIESLRNDKEQLIEESLKHEPLRRVLEIILPDGVSRILSENPYVRSSFFA